MALQMFNQLKLGVGLLTVISYGCVAGGNAEQTVTEMPPVEWKDCATVKIKTPYDDYFRHGDAIERLATAGKASDVLEELSKSREAFFRTRNPVELFPTLYFHTTSMAFEVALKNKSKQAPILLEMVIEFFDSYKYSRLAFESGGVKSVEPHWRKYYELAGRKHEKSGGLELETAVDTLAEGIDAHIIYDIPRFLRKHRDESPTQKADLETEYFRIDDIFYEASKRMLGDLRKGYELPVNAEDERTFLSGGAYVRFARKRSWELGMGDGKLSTIVTIPRYEHDPGSRVFFPRELMERGLCR